MPSAIDELLSKSGSEGTPIVGVAVVKDFDVVWLGGAPPETLFQAGSISKAVTALVAIELAGSGQLELDGDVNESLRSWQLPGSAPVTLRQLLGHTAGIGVPFFPGYDPHSQPPTLVEVLSGAPPANTEQVSVEHPPGEGFRYSGGGYAIVQQLIMDATGQRFAEVASEMVFRPLGMSDSTFEQPLPATSQMRAARADWHVYPEAAAAGLWTTPADLARFVAALQRGLAGHATPLRPSSPALMASQHVRLPAEGDWAILPSVGVRPPDNYGLGLFLEGTDRFSHLGGASGFFSILTGSVKAGNGGVVMSAADPSQFLFEVATALADEYSWDGFRATS